MELSSLWLVKTQTWYCFSPAKFKYMVLQKQSTAVMVTDIQNKGEFMGVRPFSMANKGWLERKGRREDLKNKEIV